MKINNLHRNICQKWQVFFFCYGAEMLLFLYPFLGGENSWQAVFRELP
nr:MAG TPA: hypothetical protein [Caudoviricetes sp.]